MDQPHLIEGIDAVLRRHGGTPRVWRTDRLATVIVPGTRHVQPSFAPVAKHYGAIVEPCPPRRGNRKGAVESSVRYLCGPLDAFCAGPGDARGRIPRQLLLRANASSMSEFPPEAGWSADQVAASLCSSWGRRHL